MFSMARVSCGGSGGVKADLFRFSQPRGAVRTTSSKVRDSSFSVLTVTVF